MEVRCEHTTSAPAKVVRLKSLGTGHRQGYAGSSPVISTTDSFYLSFFLTN